MTCLATICSYLPALGTVKDLFLIAGSASAIYIGFSGLNTWKRQLRGKLEWEIAKQILVATKEIKESIDRLRSGAYGLDEEVIKKKGEHGAKAEVYFDRIDTVLEAQAKLNAAMHEAKMIWGADVADLTKDLDKVIRELRAAVFYYCSSLNPENEITDKDEKRKNRQIIFRDYGEGDFSKNLDQALEKIESFFQTEISKLRSA